MRFLRQPDSYLGLICLFGGIYLAVLAAGFTERARHFPFWLSALIAGCGAWLLVQNLVRAPAGAKALDIRPVLLGALPFAVVMTAWVMALTTGLGYVIPGFFCAMALLYIAGERSPFRIAAVAAILIVACFVMFAVVFNVNLPEIRAVTDIIRPLRRLIH